MVDIQLHNPHPDLGAPAIKFLVDGVDLSDHVFTGVSLVKTGDGEFDEIGLQVTFGISPLSGKADPTANRLLINGHPVDVTGETFEAVREQVRKASTPSDLLTGEGKA